MIPLVLNGEAICNVEDYEELLDMIKRGEIKFEHRI